MNSLVISDKDLLRCPECGEEDFKVRPCSINYYGSKVVELLCKCGVMVSMHATGGEDPEISIDMDENWK